MIEPTQGKSNMSNIEHAPRTGEDYAREMAEPARLAVPRASRRPARSSARRRRDSWLLLFALLVATITIRALSLGNTHPPPKAPAPQPSPQPPPPSKPHPPHPPTTPTPP